MNPQPTAWKADALPLRYSRVSGRADLNRRPRGPKPRALTVLSYAPVRISIAYLGQNVKPRRRSPAGLPSRILPSRAMWCKFSTGHFSGKAQSGHPGRSRRMPAKALFDCAQAMAQDKPARLRGEKPLSEVPEARRSLHLVARTWNVRAGLGDFQLKNSGSRANTRGIGLP